MALVAYDVNHATFVPKFGRLQTLFLIYDFIQLNEMLQSYEITKSLIINSNILSYESLPDSIVCHLREIEDVAVALIPLKYSLFNLIKEHITIIIPCLWYSVKQSLELSVPKSGKQFLYKDFSWIKIRNI